MGRVAGWKQGLPALRRGRTALREFEPDDEAAVVALFRNPKVNRHLADPPRSRAAFRQYLEWSTKNRLAGRYSGFAVRYRGRTVGMMYIWVLAPGTAEIGFALHPDVWGTGVFQAAARLLMKFAFDSMRLHRLEIRIDVDNRRAHGAVCRLGALPEGMLHAAYAKGGRYCDSVLYCLLRDDLRR